MVIVLELVKRAFVLLALGFTICLSCRSASEEARAAEDYLRQRARVICRKHADCCGLDHQDCVNSAGPFSLDLQLSDFVEAEEASKTSFDAKQARACLDAVTALSCEGWMEAARGFPPAECDGVFAGAIPSGETCGNDFYCQSLFCFRERLPSGTYADTGVCVERAGLDEPCLSEGCKRGFVCHVGGSNLCLERHPPGTVCRVGLALSPIELF